MQRPKLNSTGAPSKTPPMKSNRTNRRIHIGGKCAASLHFSSPFSAWFDWAVGIDTKVGLPKFRCLESLSVLEQIVWISVSSFLAFSISSAFDVLMQNGKIEHFDRVAILVCHDVRRTTTDHFNSRANCAHQNQASTEDIDLSWIDHDRILLCDTYTRQGTIDPSLR